MAENVTVDDVIDPAALDLLASRLRTPLQIEDHLTRSMSLGSTQLLPYHPSTQHVDVVSLRRQT